MSDAGSGSGSGAAASAARPPLDDVMLAMDVVDTLRRKHSLVERELSEGGREADLKERLRKIYTAQGIEVSDAVLDEGVRALKEDRFLYRPPPDSFAVRLARLYVSRGSWGKWVLGALAALALAVGAWYFLIVAPRDALPGELQALHAQVTELADEATTDALADRLLEEGRRALRDGDSALAAQAAAELGQLRDQLEASYVIRVVNRPGERSGVFRIPDVNQAARNYYVIVEAVGSGGRILEVPVENEETGTVERVERWGVRVDKAVYDRVSADKLDDGIIQNDILGRKKTGVREPEYSVPTAGAAITKW
jgi:hypothetical protein